MAPRNWSRLISSSEKDANVEDKMVRAHSSTRALKIVGDTWVLRILWNAFHGAKRFSDWADVARIPRPVLVDRLQRLVSNEVMERHAYSTRPARFEYRLTERGRGLWAYLLALWDWDQTWVDDRHRVRRAMVHSGCGCHARPVLCCAACGGAVDRADVAETPGPGAVLEPRVTPRWQRRTGPLGAKGPNEDFSDELMQIVGNRWSTALVSSVARGNDKFSDLEARQHISPHLLSERLKELVACGVMERVPYSATGTRYRYLLTEKGEALLKTHWLIFEWGDRWLAGPAGPPLLVEHTICGQSFHPELHCSECGGRLRPGNFHFEPDVPSSRIALRSEPSPELAGPS